MCFYWPRGESLTYSRDYAAVTYDPPTSFRGSAIKVPKDSPSSSIWIVPGTES